VTPKNFFENIFGAIMNVELIEKAANNFAEDSLCFNRKLEREKRTHLVLF